MMMEDGRDGHVYLFIACMDGWMDDEEWMNGRMDGWMDTTDDTDVAPCWWMEWIRMDG
jgi:hypothetical protein